MDPYWTLAAFLKETRRALRSSSFKLTIRELSDVSGLAISTIHGYLNGKGFPDRDKAERLATAFYPKDRKGRREFLAQLDRLREATQGDLLARIGRAHAQLNAAVIHYPPFCGPRRDSQDAGFAKQSTAEDQAGFLDGIVKRFFLLANLDYREAEKVEVDAVGDLTMGKVDFCISLFQTYDRAREIVTFASPLRTTLNGVYIAASHGDDLDNLRRLLEPVRIGQERERFRERPPEELAQYVSHQYAPYKFVALTNEVGFSFLRDVVQLNLSDIAKADALQPAAWEAAIRKVLEGRGPRLPVVAIADEFSMLRLLGKLPPDLQNEATMLWPLATAQTASSARREAPLYPMGLLSVSKQQQAFLEYLEFGLNLLLRTDTEYISDRFKHLYEALVGDLEATFIGLPPLVRERLRDLQGNPEEFGSERTNGERWSQATAIRVARYALGLEGGPSVESSGRGALLWGPVLDRAQDKIGTREEIAMESKSVKGIVRKAEWLLEFEETAPGVPDLWSMSGGLSLAMAPFRRMLDPIEVKTASEGLSRRGHLLAGFFATPRRSEAWRFLPTPIHVPLNVLVSRDADSSLKSDLRADFAAALGRKNTTPVVTRWGAAHEYVRDIAGQSNVYPIDDMESKTLAPTLAATLAQIRARKEAVVVADTLTLLRIAGKAELRKEWEIVYPNWTDLEDGSAGGARRFLPPVFPFAIGIHSAYPATVTNLDSILRSYLRVDRERVVLLYLKEVLNLERQIGDQMKLLAHAGESDVRRAARRWARRICSVDHFALHERMESGDPWRPICGEVSRRLDESEKEPRADGGGPAPTPLPLPTPNSSDTPTGGG